MYTYIFKYYNKTVKPVHDNATCFQHETPKTVLPSIYKYKIIND